MQIGLQLTSPCKTSEQKFAQTGMLRRTVDFLPQNELYGEILKVPCREPILDSRLKVIRFVWFPRLINCRLLEDCCVPANLDRTGPPRVTYVTRFCRSNRASCSFKVTELEWFRKVSSLVAHDYNLRVLKGLNLIPVTYGKDYGSKVKYVMSFSVAVKYLYFIYHDISNSLRAFRSNREGGKAAVQDLYELPPLLVRLKSAN